MVVVAINVYILVHIYIRILLHSGSKAQDKGIPETMVLKIPVFMWSVEPSQPRSSMTSAAWASTLSSSLGVSSRALLTNMPCSGICEVYGTTVEPLCWRLLRRLLSTPHAPP